MTTDRKLDHALRSWAQADLLQGTGDEAALQRILGHADALARSAPASGLTAPAAHPHPWWWLGGLSALAASILILALVGPGVHRDGFPTVHDDGAMVLADANLDDGPVFALLFTPTNDEEYQL